MENSDLHELWNYEDPESLNMNIEMKIRDVLDQLAPEKIAKSRRNDDLISNKIKSIKEK